MNTKSSTRAVTALSANHEEADTRLILHAKGAIQNNYKRLIVFAEIPMCYCFFCITLAEQKLRFGWYRKHQSSKNVTQFTLLHQNWITMYWRILGFHALTGCDTTSSFSGMGKKTCWKQFLETPNLVHSMGRVLNVREVEEFVFRLYGGCAETESVDIDLVRFNLFSKARKGLELLPPTKDAFELHCFRADCQSMPIRPVFDYFEM